MLVIITILFIKNITILVPTITTVLTMPTMEGRHDM